MFSKRFESLRLQLLLWLLVPLLVLLSINAWFSNRAAVATANQSFDHLLTASAEAIAENVELLDGEIRVDLPYAALQLLESNLQERIFYRVIGPDGKTLTGYDDLPQPSVLPRTGDDAVFYAARYREETIHLVALKKLIYGTVPAAQVVVVVAETGEARDALSQQILVESLVRQAALIVAAAALVWFGLARGLTPLGRLREGLVARSPSDLRPIDPSGVQTEVRPLIEALNVHTARIERLLLSRQRLITDASHQMRTPLAEMRTHIEYSLRQDQAELTRQTLLDVHDDLARLARLIAQMLLLERADPDVLQDHRMGGVDLAALARTTTLDFVPAARAKRIDLSFDEPIGAARVLGTEALLRELIGNLLDNAIIYGHDGGAVAVHVIAGDEVVLVVEDDGPGIPPAERERVFERFYRGPDAALGGSGLGLSIVRDICASHHARIELRSTTESRGLSVRVTFAALA